MSFLAAMATILETGAAALRRADSSEPAVRTMRPKERIPPPPPPHPIGFWRCTTSTFDDFVVGMAYHCAPAVGSSIRIAPYQGSSWAPYWLHDERRFCYAVDKLDFVYLGATLPDGETVDARTGAERIAARRAADALPAAA